jgi:uncharacterized protein YgiM (DUF1202 family)
MSFIEFRAQYLRASLLILCAAFTVQCTSGPPTPNASSSENAELAEPEGAALDYSDGETVYVTASNLRTRAEPSTAGHVMGSFGTGERAEILHRSGEWLQVVKDARRVWISAKHVSSSPPATPQSLAPLPSRTSRESDSDSGGFAWFSKRCKKGKPCGNACISASRVCHK